MKSNGNHCVSCNWRYKRHWRWWHSGSQSHQCNTAWNRQPDQVWCMPHNWMLQQKIDTTVVQKVWKITQLRTHEYSYESWFSTRTKWWSNNLRLLRRHNTQHFPITWHYYYYWRHTRTARTTSYEASSKVQIFHRSAK